MYPSLFVSGWIHQLPSSIQIFSAERFSLKPRLTKWGQFSVWTRPGGVELKHDQESKMMGHQSALRYCWSIALLRHSFNLQLDVKPLPIPLPSTCSVNTRTGWSWQSWSPRTPGGPPEYSRPAVLPPGGGCRAPPGWFWWSFPQRSRTAQSEQQLLRNWSDGIPLYRENILLIHHISPSPNQ